MKNQIFVYELIPIPFNCTHKRVRAAQMPAYVAVHPDSRQFARWTREEAEPCSFEAMTSCRVTPPIRKDLEDRCIYEVLTARPLTSCHSEPYSELVFVRKIGHYWAIGFLPKTPWVYHVTCFTCQGFQSSQAQDSFYLSKLQK